VFRFKIKLDKILSVHDKFPLNGYFAVFCNRNESFL